MVKTYLCQAPEFPHFYYNPAVVKSLEAAFKSEVKRLDMILKKQNVVFDDVFTEGIIANSEIEGVRLDRESIHSSFVQNITPAREQEQGAVALTRMVLVHHAEPLSHCSQYIG